MVPLRTAIWTFLFCLGIWAMDIATTGMLNGLMLTNGFNVVTPDKVYHMGMWLSIIMFMLMLVEVDWSVERTRKQVLREMFEEQEDEQQ